MDEDQIKTQYHEQHHLARNSFLIKRGVLLVLSHNFLGNTFIIDKPDCLIGRGDTCDFVIPDPMVSKDHCSIKIDQDNHFYIEDHHSTNSTFVNGKEIKKTTQLFYGDKIVIGDTILRFYFEEKLDKK